VHVRGVRRVVNAVPVRNGDDDLAARRSDAVHLFHCLEHVGKMLEKVMQFDHFARGILEWPGEFIQVGNDVNAGELHGVHVHISLFDDIPAPEMKLHVFLVFNSSEYRKCRMLFICHSREGGNPEPVS